MTSLMKRLGATAFAAALAAGSALAQRYAEALKRLRAQDRDITLLITESNPKLLEAFADVTLTIERGAILHNTGLAKQH